MKREEWDASGDNTRAVAVGLQRTGRIITSAAVLLAVVIGAFSTSGIVHRVQARSNIEKPMPAMTKRSPAAASSRSMSARMRVSSMAGKV